MTTTFETGATTHAINDLILFADNTKEVAALRDEIFATCGDKCLTEPVNCFGRLLKFAQSRYVSEFTKANSQHLIKLNPAQITEFCSLYAQDYTTWKQEGAKGLELPKKIEVEAFEYFHKSAANSYFSAKVYVNNEHVLTLPFQYGYEGHYIDQAKRKLHAAGLIPNLKVYENGNSEPLWRYCQENGIELKTSKREGMKEKEVKEIGSTLPSAK